MPERRAAHSCYRRRTKSGIWAAAHEGMARSRPDLPIVFLLPLYYQSDRSMPKGRSFAARSAGAATHPAVYAAAWANVDVTALAAGSPDAMA